jgi:hypothetical protein
MTGLPGGPLTYAIATPSYRGDVERCKLLCASIDAFVSGLSMHYLLVEDRDLPIFAPLAGPRRCIIAESELLPSWLRSWPDPFSMGRRRVWTGPGALARGVKPLRGWHTQQLRKLALPLIAPEPVLLYADSDMVFLSPYDLASQVQGGRARLVRKSGAIHSGMKDHVAWVRHAAAVLGTHAPMLPADDYVTALPTWLGPNVSALLRHVAERSGRDWVCAVAAGRAFSEMMLYGNFVEHVLGERATHTPTSDGLCASYWVRDAVSGESFREGVELLSPGQVAIGVQSFIGVPMEELWSAFRRASARFG